MNDLYCLQTLALIQENESLKHRLRQADGVELERDELVRQLEMAKEDLFNEQKQARHKTEELKDVSCVYTVNCLFVTKVVSMILLKLLLPLTHNQVLELVFNNFIADTSTYKDYFEKNHSFFSTGNRKPVLSVRGNERSIPYDGSKENQRIRGCTDKSGA